MSEHENSANKHESSGKQHDNPIRDLLHLASESSEKKESPASRPESPTKSKPPTKEPPSPGFFHWTREKIATAVIFALVGGVAIESFKLFNSPPVCKIDPAKPQFGSYSYPILVTQENSDSMPATERVYRILRDNLVHVRPMSVCPPLQSLVEKKGKSSSDSIFDAIGQLSRKFNVPRAISIASEMDGRVSVNFWNQEDSKKQALQNRLTYSLNDPVQRDKLVKDVVEYVARKEIPRNRSVDIVFPSAIKGFVKTASSYEALGNFRKLQGLLDEPNHEHASCETRLSLAIIKFNLDQLLDAKVSLLEVAESNCPDSLRARALNYRGHTCLRLAAYDTDPVGSRGAFECAEASYERVGPLGIDGKMPGLILKHNLSYARYELAISSNNPEMGRKSTGGQKEVRDGILDLKRTGALPDNLAGFEKENIELGERYKIPAQAHLFVPEVITTGSVSQPPKERPPAKIQKPKPGKKTVKKPHGRYVAKRPVPYCDPIVFGTTRPTECEGPFGAMLIFPKYSNARR
jgi:hypothetical protein